MASTSIVHYLVIFHHTVWVTLAVSIDSSMEQVRWNPRLYLSSLMISLQALMWDPMINKALKLFRTWLVRFILRTVTPKRRPMSKERGYQRSTLQWVLLKKAAPSLNKLTSMTTLPHYLLARACNLQWGGQWSCQACTTGKVPMWQGGQTSCLLVNETHLICCE